jgi:23S rRNA (adenine2503-C2)-methyltransferase
MKPSIFRLTRSELAKLLHPLGEPPFRARQILSGLYRYAPSFEAMSDLPAGLRQKLGELVAYPEIRIDTVQSDPVTGTEKFALLLEDDERIEAVVLDNRDRPTTICVSSQVGCPLACRFCATGIGGFVRNLAFEELVGQVWLLLGHVRRRAPSKAAPNVVFMGMGEPLLNRAPLFEALAVLTDPERIGLGYRHVTISTIGIPEAIDELTRLGLQVHLALSLHLADEPRRRELMPGATAPLTSVLAALGRYADATGRLVTFEVVLLAGVNAAPSDALSVAELVQRFGHPSLVNVIPFNPVQGSPYETPDQITVDRYMRTLRGRGVRATVRRTQGRGIDAACGQLATRLAHAGPRRNIIGR